VPTPLEELKRELNDLIRQISEARTKRAELSAAKVAFIDNATNKAAAEAEATYTPQIQAQDDAVSSLMDQVMQRVAPNLSELFPKIKTLKLPLGEILRRTDKPSYEVKDAPGLLALLRLNRVLNKVAPAVRTVSLTELKKYPKVLAKATSKQFVTASEPDEKIIVEPYGAVKEPKAPPLSRAL
jgi:phage host-nuclease inhibitor protein Gam